MRVFFKKGEQRKFFREVIKRLGCFSLRGILQFGFKVSYDSLKNYYTERRLLPKNLFDDLCYLSKLNKNSFNVKYLNETWGRVKGGRVKTLKRVKP